MFDITHTHYVFTGHLPCVQYKYYIISTYIVLYYNIHFNSLFIHYEFDQLSTIYTSICVYRTKMYRIYD